MPPLKGSVDCVPILVSNCRQVPLAFIWAIDFD